MFSLSNCQWWPSNEQRVTIPRCLLLLIFITHNWHMLWYLLVISFSHFFYSTVIKKSVKFIDFLLLYDFCLFLLLNRFPVTYILNLFDRFILLLNWRWRIVPSWMLYFLLFGFMRHLFWFSLWNLTPGVKVFVFFGRLFLWLMCLNEKKSLMTYKQQV